MSKPIDCGRWKSHGKPMSIAEQVRFARGSSGMSQRAAATASGVSFVHLCNVENGKIGVTVALLGRLATLFDVRFAIWPERKPDA